MITITGLYIYPIKSLGGIAVSAARLERKGFAGDRRWMLVDENGRFLSQREDPRMALCQPEFSAEGITITDRTGRQSPLVFSTLLKGNEEKIPVTIWDDTCTGLLVSTEANNWFSHLLQRPCRLVQLAPEDERPVDPRYARATDAVSFADGFPYLLTNEASLADLNRQLDEPVPMLRFRPNIIISGVPAWIEDEWQHFQLGNHTFRSTKPCARCQVITINPETGEKGIEPLRTLSQFRKHNNKVYFGLNTCWEPTTGDATVRVGDTLTLIK